MQCFTYIQLWCCSEKIPTLLEQSNQENRSALGSSWMKKAINFLKGLFWSYLLWLIHRLAFARWLIRSMCFPKKIADFSFWLDVHTNFNDRDEYSDSWLEQYLSCGCKCNKRTCYQLLRQKVVIGLKVVSWTTTSKIDNDCGNEGNSFRNT